MIYFDWSSLGVRESYMDCIYLWDKMALYNGRETCSLEDPIYQLIYAISVNIDFL